MSISFLLNRVVVPWGIVSVKHLSLHNTEEYLRWCIKHGEFSPPFPPIPCFYLLYLTVEHCFEWYSEIELQFPPLGRSRHIGTFIGRCNTFNFSIKSLRLFFCLRPLSQFLLFHLLQSLKIHLKRPSSPNKQSLFSFHIKWQCSVMAEKDIWF